MALREILAKFGFEVDSKNLKDADAKTKGFSDKIKALAGVIAAGAIVGKLRDFVSELKETGLNIRKTGALMGISTHDAQRWTVAAELAGVSAEAFAVGVKFLQKNMIAAAEGGGDTAAVFQKLGVKVKDAAGNIRPTGDALKNVILGISGIKNPAEKTAATLKVFGRSGVELLPLINQGAAGLEELLGKLDELGGGISDQAIEALRANTRATKEYDLVMLSLKSRLVTQILPSFTSFIRTGIKLASGFTDMAKKSNVFKAAAIVMGTIAVAWAVSIYAAYLPLLAGIAGLVLLVDDLITLFEGGDSVIGAFLDKIFGQGASKSFVAKLIEELRDLKRQAEETGPSVAAVARGERAGGKTEPQGYWSAIWTRILRGVKQFGSDFTSGLGDLWWWVKDLGSRIIDAIGEWFVGIGSQIARGAKRFANDFTTGLSDMLWWVKQLGSDLIDGLVEGITNGAGKVVDAFKSMGKKAFAAIRGVFDSHSPSRALFKFVYEDLIQGGLVRGAKAGQPDFNNAMADMYSVPGGGKGGGPVTVYQTNNNDIDVHAGGNAGSIANQVRDGQNGVNNDNRRALLAALETTG